MVVVRKEPRTKPAKSETLTIRLDPKTRFMLEFMARVRGQTITTVVERSLIAAAAEVTIYDGHESRGWDHYWDIDDGIRALVVAGTPGLYPSYEEEERLAFAREHWPFFYISDRKTTLRRSNVAVLWPRIDEFMAVWRETRTTNYHAAGEAMQDALQKAGLKVPAWPQPPPVELPDDPGEIPF